MQKENTKNKSLFSQYLLIYFLTAFTPALITCCSLFLSYQALEKEIIKSNKTSIFQIQQSFDSNIAELEKIIYAVKLNPSLSRFSINDKSIAALNTLESYINMQNFAQSLLIKPNNISYFYSSAGLFSTDDLVHQGFMKNFLKHGYSQNDFCSVMESSCTTTFWPVNQFENPSSFLCMIFPLSFSYDAQANKVPISTATFIIRMDVIRELFLSSQTTSEEGIIVLNSNFDLLCQLASSHDANNTPLKIHKYINDNPSIIGDGYSYCSEIDQMLFLSQSSDTGLIYIRYLPKAIAFLDFNIIRTYTIIILGLVILVSILLISYGMVKNYDPIQTLAEDILNYYPELNSIHNELMLFSKVLDDTFEENSSLSQTISNSKCGLVDHLLSSLIKGSFLTKESFLNACNNLNISLDAPFYSVCTFLIENTDVLETDSLNFEKILDTIKASFSQNYRVLVKNLLFANKLILIVACDSNNDTQYYQQIQKVKEDLLAYDELLTSAGIGNIYDSFDKIGKSYLESVSALDYRLIYGKNCLILPQTYNEHVTPTNYPHSLMSLLHSALTSKNYELTISAIQKIYKYTKSGNCSIHTAKSICYDVFSILKIAFINNDSGYDNKLPTALNITKLTTFNTIDEFFITLQSIIQEMFLPNIKKTISSTTELGIQLVSYIDENVFSYDFQINRMAEHFSISRQHMRTVFKNHTGVGLSEYIATKKLHKAMNLLSDSDLPLQEIVNEIGNTDISGFIRSFKQHTGMTPGQYRKSKRG